ncbi:MAG: hypothetical protein WAO76_02280 [Georgfuchsia sp.]
MALESIADLGNYSSGDMDLCFYHQALVQSGDVVVIINLPARSSMRMPRLKPLQIIQPSKRSDTVLLSSSRATTTPASLPTSWALTETGAAFAIFFIRCKNGSLFDEEKTIVRIMNWDGFITCYVSTGHTVDARIVTERRLQQLAYYDTFGHSARENALRLIESRLGHRLKVVHRASSFVKSPLSLSTYM